MRESDFDRVVFFSIEDLGVGHHLSKAEKILRNEVKSEYDDINDVLELYNIKKFIDNELYLKKWSQKEIEEFNQRMDEYGRIVGQFMSNINDSNVIYCHGHLLQDYINSFWELVNNQSAYKQISAKHFADILKNYPHEISIILILKNLVIHYDAVLREFLLSYPRSTEILLTIYEVKDVFNNKEKMYLPNILTIQDKENIVSQYVDSESANLNYLRLILNAKNRSEFRVSDKTRLKAKRRAKVETDKIFEEGGNVSRLKYGVSISFPANEDKIKDGYVKDSVTHYSYSLDFIKKNNDFYSLFLNFKILFEYLDIWNRIDLVSKNYQMGVIEKFMGIQSQNEYRCSFSFKMSEMASSAQIYAYSEIINGLGFSLDNILQHVFMTIFQEKYTFANNARLSMPSSTVSFFEKVRLLAPEFESVLKQYKLFVENEGIDFELLQISSSPTALKDIPSLLQNKYIYLNEDNEEIVGCSNLFFSDQTTLAYVDPYKEKQYHYFFDLIANEKVDFKNYDEYQKQRINYLINKGFLFLDENNYIQFSNFQRVAILKDLYENEVGSFYHYPIDFQEEAKQMKVKNMVFFENSLFSKPEISYFNYYLNKSEYTNGLDLRNSYLHGTQANPEEQQIHEHAYFVYMKLLVLVLLKMEDDLLISQVIKK